MAGSPGSAELVRMRKSFENCNGTEIIIYKNVIIKPTMGFQKVGLTFAVCHHPLQINRIWREDLCSLKNEPSL